MAHNGNDKINSILETFLPNKFTVPLNEKDFYQFLHDKYVDKKYKSLIDESIQYNTSDNMFSPVSYDVSASLLLNSDVSQKFNNNIFAKLDVDLFSFPIYDCGIVKSEILKLFDGQQNIIEDEIDTFNEIYRTQIDKLFNTI
jgi:hypothetical protein